MSGTMICLNTTTILMVFFVTLAAISVAFYFFFKKSNAVNDIARNIRIKLDTAGSTPIRMIKEQPDERFPDRQYIGQRDYSDISQGVGFVYNSQGERFPLYSQRLDNRYYYHVKDDSRNGIRIVVNTKQNQEIYDGETIPIPEMGGEFTAKIYDYSGNRYNPFAY